MFLLAFLFIFGDATAFETNIANNNTNVYDGLNDIDCVAVNSTTKCRFKQGNTAIIIARADHISTGCRFEFTSPGGRSCCYTSVLGHSLDHQQDLCPAAEEKKEFQLSPRVFPDGIRWYQEEITCRDNSTFLVEEVWQGGKRCVLQLFHFQPSDEGRYVLRDGKVIEVEEDLGSVPWLTWQLVVGGVCSVGLLCLVCVTCAATIDCTEDWCIRKEALAIWIWRRGSANRNTIEEQEACV